MSIRTNFFAGKIQETEKTGATESRKSVPYMSGEEKALKSGASIFTVAANASGKSENSQEAQKADAAVSEANSSKALSGSWDQKSKIASENSKAREKDMEKLAATTQQAGQQASAKFMSNAKAINSFDSKTQKSEKEIKSLSNELNSLKDEDAKAADAEPTTEATAEPTQSLEPQAGATPAANNKQGGLLGNGKGLLSNNTGAQTATNTIPPATTQSNTIPKASGGSAKPSSGTAAKQSALTSKMNSLSNRIKGNHNSIKKLSNSTKSTKNNFASLVTTTQNKVADTTEKIKGENEVAKNADKVGKVTQLVGAATTATGGIMTACLNPAGVVVSAVGTGVTVAGTVTSGLAQIAQDDLAGASATTAQTSAVADKTLKTVTPAEKKADDEAKKAKAS